MLCDLSRRAQREADDVHTILGRLDVLAVAAARPVGDTAPPDIPSEHEDDEDDEAHTYRLAILS